jgi:hypothetical protein
MPRRDKFHFALDTLLAGRHFAIKPSGRDISVLFLEQPEPGVHIAVGYLE